MIAQHVLTAEEAQQVADLLQLYLAVNASGGATLFTHRPVADAHDGEWHADLMCHPESLRTGLPRVTVNGVLHWTQKVWKPTPPPVAPPHLP